MKKMMILIAMLAVAGVAQAQAVLVDDFTGASAGTSDTSLRLTDSDVDTWKGLSGDRATIQTTGGNPDSYLSFDAANADGVIGRLSSGKWLDVATLGLTAGTTYYLQFDYYFVDSATVTDEAFGYQVAENNGSELGYGSSITVSGPTDTQIFAAQSTSTFDVNGTLSLADTGGSWVTYTSTIPIVLDADDSKIFVGFSGRGFDTGEGSDMRIDNVLIVGSGQATQRGSFFQVR